MVVTGIIVCVAIRGCILFFEGKGDHTLKRPFE